MYNSVLGFDGDEFYMSEWSDITGKGLLKALRLMFFEHCHHSYDD